MRIRLHQTVDLIIDCWHLAEASGQGILRIAGTDRIIDASALREDPETRIITDDPRAVCRVLGIGFPDPQVIGGQYDRTCQKTEREAQIAIRKRERKSS